MTQRSCPLCSRLSSALRSFAARFSRGILCRDLHCHTYDLVDRVAAINTAAPKCGCEKHRMTKHSPHVVQSDERLTRFVFSPLHLNTKRNSIKPNLFSHIASRGCSIQRDSIATTSEITTFVSDFLNQEMKPTWFGVVSTGCATVKGFLTDDKRRLLCVYDTAEPSNPAHAEMGRGSDFEEGDEQELRKLLWDAFQCSAPVRPQHYRDGAVWNALSPELQARPSA